MSNIISSLRPYFEPAKTAVEFAKPYVPLTATAWIVAKISWHIRKHGELQKKLTKSLIRIDKKITLLTDIKSKASSTPKQTNKINQQIKQLNGKKTEIQKQLNIPLFQFSQIPALLFDHPGSNPYQSIHNIVGRTVQFKKGENSSWMYKAASVISIVGAAASLCRTFGFVDQEDETSQILCYSAMFVHASECALWIKTHHAPLMKSLKNIINPDNSCKKG